MKPASGNVNDIQGFKAIVKSPIKSLKAAQSCRYLVADSALYVKETIVELDKLAQLFITRVPQKLKETNTLIAQSSTLEFTDIGHGYSGVWHHSTDGGVKQKWRLISSEQAKKREAHNLTKRMLKKAEAERKSVKKLSQQRFSCQEDAQKSLKLWRHKQTYSDVIEEIMSLPVYGKKTAILGNK